MFLELSSTLCQNGMLATLFLQAQGTKNWLRTRWICLDLSQNPGNAVSGGKAKKPHMILWG